MLWEKSALQAPIDGGFRMHKRILVILTGWLLAWGGLNGLAAEPPATPEQIAKWVKQLGADDFDAREDAEAALIKAGTAALVELKKAAQSGDPEVKTRSARIAEKLKWAVLPDIGDLATVLPPDNIFFVGTPSSKQLIERIRKETALGRLYDHRAILHFRGKTVYSGRGL